MLTLSQATSDTRKTLKIIAIAIGAILSLIIIVKGLLALKEIVSPTPPPPPTVSFGRLPKISFPQNATPKKLTYTLSTVSGSLPQFPDRLTVNKVLGYSPDILAVDKANSKASGLGFIIPGQRLSDINYRWNDSSPLRKELTMDIVTNDFVLTSLFLEDPNVLAAKSLSDQKSAGNASLEFLGKGNLLPPDIDSSQTTTTLLKIDHGALIQASSLSETQVIGVNLYQKNVNDLPIYYPKADGSTMNFLVGASESGPVVVGADFSYQAVSTDSATYPIKTASEAFQELKDGKAYISTYYSGEEIKIRDIFFAYYMGEEKQEFLMPIVVFKGDDGFYAYVSAVKDEWTNN